MILAFKVRQVAMLSLRFYSSTIVQGTTFSMEMNTNGLSSAVQVRAAENVLYGEKAHKGMGQGMFETFTYVGETQDAFGESHG
jgi:hypothetical protein